MLRESGTEIQEGWTWAQQDAEVCQMYRSAGRKPPQAFWFGDFQSYFEERCRQ